MTPRSHLERRHEMTRRAIVEEAWELAERDGIAGLSLRELAGRLGMRAPSLYTYFDGKDAIYDAMFAQGWEELGERLRNTLDSVDADDRRTVLVAGIESWLGFCQESIPRYQLMHTAAIPGWAPSAGAYAASERAYAEMVGLFDGLGIRGRDEIDLYTALTAGLAAQQLANDPGGDRWVRLVPDAVEMFLQHLDTKDDR